MAVFQTEAPQQINLSGFDEFLARVSERYAAWRQIRITRQQLLNLNDRELEDLGLVRENIKKNDFTQSL